MEECAALPRPEEEEARQLDETIYEIESRKAEKSVRGVRRRSKAYCTNNRRFVVTKGVGYRKTNEFPFDVGIVAPQGAQVYHISIDILA